MTQIKQIIYPMQHLRASEESVGHQKDIVRIVIIVVNYLRNLREKLCHADDADLADYLSPLRKYLWTSEKSVGKQKDIVRIVIIVVKQLGCPVRCTNFSSLS